MKIRWEMDNFRALFFKYFAAGHPKIEYILAMTLFKYLFPVASGFDIII